MKTVDTIYGELLACFAQRTGLEPREGCDLSARLYAVAAQVAALHVQGDWVARQAFPQSAQGEYLDRHAQLRGLARKTAVAARGLVRFGAGEPAKAARTIPVGTVCMTAGLIRFETTQTGVLALGASSVDVPVQAVLAGAAGNVGEGAIGSMAVAPMGISTCTNPHPCAGGTDEEGDEDLRRRVLDTFLRLPNGANMAFYQQGALSFDRVAAATVIPRPRGTGTVDVVAATLEGVPDAALLAQLREYFQTRREIAVEVQVRPPQTLPMHLEVMLTTRPGQVHAQVASQVEQTLRGYFTGKLLGQDVLLAKLGSLIYGCDGVLNYQIIAPAADVAIGADVLPVLGTLRVEEVA